MITKQAGGSIQAMVKAKYLRLQPGKFSFRRTCHPVFAGSICKSADVLAELVKPISEHL